MLPVKVVRSLLLGETMKNPPHYHHDNHPHHHHHHHHDHSNSDADDEHDHDHRQHHHHHFNPCKKNRKIPMLLFTPTKELITDTFRLASLARDLGMNFHPSPSLSHLIFSWPNPNPNTNPALHSLSSSTTSSPFTPSSKASTSRPSTSSATSSLTNNNNNNILNDAVPIPFPTLSSPSTSLSLLRFFVSLSKGLFKLVFFNLDPRSDFETNPDHNFDKYRYPFGQIENHGGGLLLHSKVSGRRVRSMDVFAREMAGHGWGMFRTVEKGGGGGNVDNGGVVYLFRRKEVSRVKVSSVGNSVNVISRGRIGNGNENLGGECRVRELRLPTLDFEHEVPLRVLLYIVLMADDVFYLA